MSSYDFEIPVTFRHRIRFTTDAFAPENPVVADLLAGDRPVKVLVYVETEIVRHFPDLRAQITAYLAALGIERNGDAWESYVSDPTRVPESEILTDVYYPIR